MGNYISKSLKADPADGKKKITAKLIHDELKRQDKTILVLAIIFGIVLLLLCLTFIFVLIIDSIFNATATKIIKAVLFIIPLVYFAYCWYLYYRMRNYTNNRKYTIVTDVVERIVEADRLVKVHTRRGVKYVPQHAMYLKNCGRIVISLEDMFTYISKGDQYYVVVDKKKPNKPILYYNAKFYELDESK